MSVLLLGNNQNKIKMSKELTQEHFNYAKLSKDAYNNHKKEICNNDNLPTGYTRLEQNSNDKSGYNSIAYRNDKTGEIIIVHRGTEVGIINPNTTVKDIQADIALALGKTPQQLKDAEKFLKEISEKYNVSPNKIINSGHSLGGYLSNEIARKFEGKSISFDPPGYVKPKLLPGFEPWIKEHNKKIESEYLERAKKQGDNTVILAPSNAVNRIGEHSGRIIQLPDDSWLPNILDHKIEKIENIIKLGKTVERKCAALYDPVSNPLGPGNIQLSTASQNLLASCS